MFDEASKPRIWKSQVRWWSCEMLEDLLPISSKLMFGRIRRDFDEKSYVYGRGRRGHKRIFFKLWRVNRSLEIDKRRFAIRKYGRLCHGFSGRCRFIHLREDTDDICILSRLQEQLKLCSINEVWSHYIIWTKLRRCSSIMCSIVKWISNECYSFLLRRGSLRGFDNLKERLELLKLLDSVSWWHAVYPSFTELNDHIKAFRWFRISFFFRWCLVDGIQHVESNIEAIPDR